MSREIAFRFELLRGGAYYAMLRAVNRSPRLRMNSEDSRKFLLSADYAAEAEDVDGRPMPINWLTDEISPVMVLDGTEHRLGVYVPSKPVFNRSGPVKSWSVSAYDRTQKVFKSNTRSLLYWPAGTLRLDAVEQLLTAAGINTVFKTQNASVFSEAREDWAVGANNLDVVNELLREINYNPLWFNANGAAVLEPASVPEPSAVEHILDTDDPDTRIVSGNISRVQDYYDAANVFVAICQNPEKGDAMVSVAVNDNPQSPLSVQRMGREIVSVTYVNNIADQTALDAFAARLRNESMISGEVIELETALLPGWGVADVVAINDHGETGICISQNFDMELQVGGRMRHKLKKVVYNLDA